ncbi:MAG TPA: AraC family transcriptional regulator [Coriobacteriia bacterium]|jgi:AraC-like DNA-binding protein
MARTPTHPDVEFKRDPDLPGVEARVSRYAERAFRLHTHNEYSIALVESGATTFELHGEPHRGVAGQLVFVDPGAVHACNPDQDSTFAYRLFYIDARWFAEVAAEVFGDAPTRIALAPPVVDDPELFEAWHRLHVAIMEGAEGLEKESALVSNIAATIERYSAEPSAPQGAPAAGQAVAKVRDLLAERVAEKVSLDELAAEAGMSRYHFLRVFQHAAGLPPHAFQAQLRVEIAKQLLAGGEPIARVAAEVGFADQSHFTRVFREFTGATPRQYQASARESA